MPAQRYECNKYPSIIHLKMVKMVHSMLCERKVKVLVDQSHPTLCNAMDCSPSGSSVHGDSPGKNTTRVGCHALLQGIFPIQGLDPGLLHCRQILYHLSHQGSPCYMNITSIKNLLMNILFTIHVSV